ncbi:MAG: hypothetical protein AMXMBFR64_01730 [Myxococcales bacterium]
MRIDRALLALAVGIAAAACGDSDDGATPGGGAELTDAGSGSDTGSPTDTGGGTDAGNTDAGNTDAGNTDAGSTDTDYTDAGNTDAGNTDTGGTDAGGTPTPNPIPSDYKATFTKVTDRAKSDTHEGMMVEVWINDLAKAAFDAGAGPFAEGSIVIKEHYGDDTTTDVMAWTTMEKRSAGYAPDTGDWYWAKVMGDGTVEMDGTPAMCTACHAAAKDKDWVFTLEETTASGNDPVPDDYKSTFTKVTERAVSQSHEGMMVEIWVNDTAKPTWDSGSGVYAKGSIVIKEHYMDEASTDVKAWTTMEKREAGYAPDSGDWYWAKVMGDGTVEMDGTPAMCVGCHSTAKDVDWVMSKL